MTPNAAPPHVNELEGAVAALRGVRAARVHSTPAGLESVRVLVVPERDPGEVVTEIQGMVFAHLGTTLETHAIEVMKATGAAAANGRPKRRKLSSLATKRSGDRFTSQVILELDGDLLIGEDDSPSGRRFEPRSVAEAVLDAVRQLVAEPLELGAADFIEMGDCRIAAVAVERASDLLLGSALVTLDEHDAIARATLDAVNRVLPGSRTA
ncbi:MAG TPA: hypothetical protein VG318_00155 [Actinomycetota bacterium]|nr:hypothetical protein [Actinomycetota bacterium]